MCPMCLRGKCTCSSWLDEPSEAQTRVSKAPVRVRVREKVKPVEPALDPDWEMEFKYKFAREMAFVSLMKWAMACLTIISVVVATR